MDKECCNIRVTEIENGYRIEISGAEVKDKWKTILERFCCGGTSWKEHLKNCCGTDS